MAIETRDLNISVTIITPRDTWSGNDLHQAGKNAIDAGKLNIVVNLSAVPGLSVERAYALDMLYKDTEMRGGKLKLVKVTDGSRTGLLAAGSVLGAQPAYDSDAEAVVSFA